jgi:hypothetical protein
VTATINPKVAFARLLEQCLAEIEALETVPTVVPPAPPAPAPVPPVPTVLPAAVTVDGDLKVLLDAFPDAVVTELRLAGPFDRMDLQRAFPDAEIVPLGDETPGAAAAEPWTWSLPLPPRRAREREPRPEPEAIQGRPCRFCGLSTDPRETGGDPDGRFSHLECWAKAGHPDVGHAKAVAAASPRAVEPCKCCGLPIDWKRDGVAFGDGSGAHVACYERAG